MGLFREEGISVLATVAVCTGLVLAAVPAGMYAARQFSDRSESRAGVEIDAIWLAATALTVQDERGGRRLLATAMKMRNAEDAERMCRFIPFIRDRLVLLASQGKIDVTPKRVSVDGETMQVLERDLNAMLRKRGPLEIFLYDSTHPGRLPKSVNKGMNKPARCDGFRLTGF